MHSIMFLYFPLVVAYLPAKKRQQPYQILYIVIIVGVLMIGFMWQMKSASICQLHAPPMNVDSEIMSSEKVDKVNVLKPAAPNKPLYEFDHNQPGVVIYVSESAIVFIVLVVLFVMYITTQD